MNEETQDQVQEGTQTEQSPKEQSETTKVDQELYDLPDGRKVDAKTLSREWKENFMPDYTKKSQRLSEYEKSQLEAETRAEDSANKAIDENELFNSVDPNVKLVLKAAFKAFIKEENEAKAKAEKDAKLAADLKAAEEKYNGKDGKPKWNSEEMVPFMVEKGIYDYDVAYETKYKEIIYDDLIKKALKDKGIDISTETTGGEAPKKPQGKSPKTLSEAAEAAFRRITTSE